MLQAELHLGISNRAVAATRMNASSSRSHAIFTIHVQQRRLVSAGAASPAPSEDPSAGLHRKDSSRSAREGEQMEELVEAHMVFVDLAGKQVGVWWLSACHADLLLSVILVHVSMFSLCCFMDAVHRTVAWFLVHTQMGSVALLLLAAIQPQCSELLLIMRSPP